MEGNDKFARCKHWFLLYHSVAILPSPLNPNRFFLNFLSIWHGPEINKQLLNLMCVSDVRFTLCSSFSFKLQSILLLSPTSLEIVLKTAPVRMAIRMQKRKLSINQAKY